MINRVTLVGNLGKDPEIRHLENGTAVGKFSVATNESYRDRNGEWQKLTEWHDIVVWRDLAERVERSLKKGMLVYIEGKLTHRRYQDKDGIDRRTTEVVARIVRSLERREANMMGSDPSFPSISDEQKSTSGAQIDNSVSDDQLDDDLPF